MEFTISTSCGFLVHRQSCYRAEGFLAVVPNALLIITDGGKDHLPSYFVYDTRLCFSVFSSKSVVKRNEEDFEVELDSGKMYTIVDVVQTNPLQ